MADADSEVVIALGAGEDHVDDFWLSEDLPLLSGGLFGVDKDVRVSVVGHFSLLVLVEPGEVLEQLRVFVSRVISFN